MKLLYKVAIIVLLNIYLVTIAGSFVRMSGAGMGCPDWPKCFGYWIPPSNVDQLTWGKGKGFEEGQMIIAEDKSLKKDVLLVAKTNFKANNVFNINNWEKYTKHNYTVFNKYHTWIEYINRQTTTLIGLISFLLLLLSLKFWKKDKWLPLIAFIQLFIIGFEAWLGKLTVESNLAPVTLTYHMLGVIILIIIQVYFLKRIKSHVVKKETKLLNPKLKYTILVASILLIIQIVMGSQVRQQVDVFIEAGTSRDLIPEGFTAIFYVHRSYSIILTLIIGFIILKLWKQLNLRKVLFFLGGTLIFEVLTGMFLFYLGMQAYGQPFHLTLSLIMLGLLFKLFFKLDKR